MKKKIKAFLEGTGPILMSRFLPEWGKINADTPFEREAWGFERLTNVFESIPDIIVITKDGPKKSWVSLVGGPLPNIETNDTTPEAPAPKAAAGLSRVAMSGVLAGVIASKMPSVVDVDPAQVEKFMRQPKLQFTIDCLVEAFTKFSAASQAGAEDPPAQAKPKKAKKPRTRRGAAGAAAEAPGDQ